MKELEVRREKLGLKREIVTRDIPQDNVHCECGWTQDEGDMVCIKAMDLLQSLCC